MFLKHLFLIVLSFLAQATLLASALGSTCSSPLGAGTAGSNDPFWLENIQHQVCLCAMAAIHGVDVACLLLGNGTFEFGCQYLPGLP